MKLTPKLRRALKYQYLIPDQPPEVPRQDKQGYYATVSAIKGDEDESRARVVRLRLQADSDEAAVAEREALYTRLILEGKAINVKRAEKELSAKRAELKKKGRTRILLHKHKDDFDATNFGVYRKKKEIRYFRYYYQVRLFGMPFGEFNSRKEAKTVRDQVIERLGGPKILDLKPCKECGNIPIFVRRAAPDAKQTEELNKPDALVHEVEGCSNKIRFNPYRAYKQIQVEVWNNHFANNKTGMTGDIGMTAIREFLMSR